MSDSTLAVPFGESGPDAESDLVGARGVVIVEGLPGSGKSTNAAALASWLKDAGADAQHWPEGRSDHPVDVENASILSDETVTRLREEDPHSWRRLQTHAERCPDGWLVRSTDQLDLSDDLTRLIQSRDVYDGEIAPEQHTRLLSANWRRYGAETPKPTVQVWECVLIQNPVCALIARFDQSPAVLAAHVHGLVDAIGSHRPLLVYLDPGDPEPVLRRAAAERPAWWLDLVIRYHTEQGYGLRHELAGFDGYVDFMRMRRTLELDLLPRLDLPTLVIRTSAESADTTRRRMQDFVRTHLTVDA